MMPYCLDKMYKNFPEETSALFKIEDCSEFRIKMKDILVMSGVSELFAEKVSSQVAFRRYMFNKSKEERR
jgi:hypothetical protein